MNRKVRILWYNWKDIKNPEAGGAEVFTHEVAKRLVADGYVVTLFTSFFEGSQKEASLDGISIIRQGTRTSVQRFGRTFYEAHKNDFDIVIDEVNTKPFMTPSFVKKPKIALIHQLAREYWLYEVPFPANLLGYLFLERYWLGKYVDIPTITVSKSTEGDLRGLGFKRTFVVPEGLSIPELDNPPDKESSPVVVYLGRLTRAKRPSHLLKAFRLIVEKHPDASLWFVGDGYLRKSLQRQAPRQVVFFGRVPTRKVWELLERAWVLVYPSVREGFGLSIIEANAYATPAIGYDVPGVRDAIIDGRTGILVPNGNIPALSTSLTRILENKELRLALSEEALEHSKEFSWDKTAVAFKRIIDATV